MGSEEYRIGNFRNRGAVPLPPPRAGLPPPWHLHGRPKPAAWGQCRDVREAVAGMTREGTQGRAVPSTPHHVPCTVSRKSSAGAAGNCPPPRLPALPALAVPRQRPLWVRPSVTAAGHKRRRQVPSSVSQGKAKGDRFGAERQRMNNWHSPSGMFCDNRKTHSEIHMESKGTLNGLKQS